MNKEVFSQFTVYTAIKTLSLKQQSCAKTHNQRCWFSNEKLRARLIDNDENARDML